MHIIGQQSVVVWIEQDRQGKVKFIDKRRNFLLRFTHVHRQHAQLIAVLHSQPVEIGHSVNTTSTMVRRLAPTPRRIAGNYSSANKVEQA